MCNRAAFITSFSHVTVLLCSNIFSSSICEPDGDVIDSKGKGAALSLHRAGVAFQEHVALSCSHANHCRTEINGNRVRSRPSAFENHMLLCQSLGLPQVRLCQVQLPRKCSLLSRRKYKMPM